MYKIKKILLFIILFISVCFSFSFSEYEDRISEYTLPNGIHIIILEDHTAPVVSFVVCVDTGSVDEKTGETGISHLIEHLAFNGTEKIGTKNWEKEKKLFEEMDRIYEKMIKTKDNKTYNLLNNRFNNLKKIASSYGEPNEFGKILDRNGAIGPNAYTSNDITVYWVELPSNRIELWAYLESDRLFNPAFRSFYEELEVVKEERRMRVENSPRGKLMEELHKAAFKIHPYRNPVIGYKEDLDMMTREKVKNFYKRHYVPSNITVVIAGDITKKEIVPILEKYFGKIPSDKKPKRDIPPEPICEEIRRVNLTMDSQPFFITTFQIPDINHPDSCSLDVCAEIIGGGRTSRLYRNLVKEEQVAISVGCWARSARYPSLFYIWAIPAKGKTNRDVENFVIEEIERMKREGIEEDEMEGAKARLSMDILKGLKERRGLAEQLGIYHVLTGNWRNLFRYIEQIEKVSIDEVKRVLNKYLDTNRMVVGTVEKK